MAGSVGVALRFVETPQMHALHVHSSYEELSHPLSDGLSRAASWQRGPSSLSQQEGAPP